ncbi:MAG: cytochrome c maturation protein CcmE [Alphaproteobacteria bacterium]
MKRKTQRMVFVVSGLSLLGIAAALIFYAIGDNLRFFMSPTDLFAAEERPSGTFRMGGLVMDGSVNRAEDMFITFQVTDNVYDITVEYDQQTYGLLPDLFREGQGVVVEGTLKNENTFVAERVLAKHDENYMPPEVADALKRSEHWQDSYQ